MNRTLNSDKSSNTGGGLVAALSPFTLMSDIFVIEFRLFNETFRKTYFTKF